MNNRKPTNRLAAISERWFRPMLAALALAVILTVTLSPLHAQTTTRYVYDDNGRLHAVIAPNGEANIYEYDAAGNITAIRRNTATTLEVLDFSPKDGVPGIQVTIIGTGFGGGVNTVTFNGVTAQIVSANAPVVIVTVPNGATTGPITVTTPQGAATTSKPFIVKGVQLTPLTAGLIPSQMQQFTAVVFPVALAQSIKWTVNEVEGGSASVGTISATGLYTAPMFPFQPATVRATSVADPSLYEEARVTLLIPPPHPTPIAATVSIQRASVTGTSTTIGVVGAGISIRRDTPASVTTIAPIGAGVSIRRDTTSSPTTIALVGAGVSTTMGPYISAISPNSLTRGATETVTITGMNLSGAASLSFIDDSGVSDATIMAANITVNAGGTSLMTNVTTSGTTVLGRRLVIITTATNRSLGVGTGSNTIQIVP